MNTLTALLLFLVGGFALVIGFLSVPSIQYYTGGVLIGLFIAGLLMVSGVKAGGPTVSR